MCWVLLAQRLTPFRWRWCSCLLCLKRHEASQRRTSWRCGRSTNERPDRFGFLGFVGKPDRFGWRSLWHVSRHASAALAKQYPIHRETMNYHELIYQHTVQGTGWENLICIKAISKQETHLQEGNLMFAAHCPTKRAAFMTVI